jgi:hypothetical protein
LGKSKIANMDQKDGNSLEKGRKIHENIKKSVKNLRK